jgi:hypothetical protein
MCWLKEYSYITCKHVFACRGPAGIAAIPIIIEGQLQVFQQFSSSKLVLKTVESCYVALNYFGNGSIDVCKTITPRKQDRSY